MIKKYHVGEVRPSQARLRADRQQHSYEGL